MNYIKKLANLVTYGPKRLFDSATERSKKRNNDGNVPPCDRWSTVLDVTGVPLDIQARLIIDVKDMYSKHKIPGPLFIAQRNSVNNNYLLFSGPITENQKLGSDQALEEIVRKLQILSAAINYPVRLVSMPFTDPVLNIYFEICKTDSENK
jgi:hypothetical protein